MQMSHLVWPAWLVDMLSQLISTLFFGLIFMIVTILVPSYDVYLVTHSFEGRGCVAVNWVYAFVTSVVIDS